MRRSLLKPLLLVLLAFLACASFGQNHVTWSVGPVTGKEGEVVTVKLIASIDKGWHLYSIVPTKGEGPVPTTVTVDAPLSLGGQVTESKPITKLDPNFGLVVNFFQDKAEFDIPVKLGAKPTDGALSVRFQLCNDNTCIPPTKVSVPLAGSTAPATTGSPVATSDTDHVTWSFNPVTGKAGEIVNVEVTADIDKGWHLYSIVPTKGDGPVPTTITVKAPATLAGKVTEGKPISKLDPNFNLVVNYFQDFAKFTVPVKLGKDATEGALSIRFQLCNDSTCIPPKTITMGLAGPDGGDSFPDAPANHWAYENHAAALNALSATPSGDAYTAQVNNAKQQGLFAFLALSFGAGLLSLLTPCVFPMIPITVSFFSKRKNVAGKKTGLAEAIAYCLGIVGSFAVFGVVVTLVFGASGIQSFATNPWINIALASIFVVLALSLLGIYSISLPPKLVNTFSGAQGKGGFVAPMLMGLTFTLTSFTCTVPFVGTILAGAAQGDLVFPVLGMIAYGTAFALPFFLLALFPQYLAKLPKSGSWLETVKAFMGFIEVAAALKFLSNADLVLRTNLLSRPIFLGTWIVIALAAGLFLLGVFPLPHIEKPKKLGPIRMGFGIASIALVVWFCTSIGGRSLGELEAFMPPTENGGWLKDYKEALALAKKKNLPILINFTGVTCTNCRWMEKNMFPRDEVKKQLDKYVTVELYTDREIASDVSNQALQKQLTNVSTLPEYVELTPEGQKKNVFQGSTRDAGQFVGFLKTGA